jgi:hypothetical protein
LLAAALVPGWRQGAVGQLNAFARLLLGLLEGAVGGAGNHRAVHDGAGTNGRVPILRSLLIAMMIGQTVGGAVGVRLHRAMPTAGVDRVDRAAGIGVGGVLFLLVVWVLAAV